MPAAKFGNYCKQAADAAGSVQRIDEFLDDSQTRQDLDATMAQPLLWQREEPESKPRDALVLVDLSLVYAGASQPALTDISMTLAPGSLTVICGPSGCGLSSLISLLTTRVPPSSGQISFQGVKLHGRAGPAHELRQRISLLSRETCVLAATEGHAVL